ncbi:FAD dependent oxidoreductase [Methanohalobium evestigatum Z-7303]|uniref:FAD dependent oxidoreductase n=1 Tax=Methanohalobium evestigatum (strain ATCC BAA-1072 / DSM 3721 / NBRC 107634 / OCM 161 / Z-7303) TaxID=644295 RepID=D7E6H3_METEZ|nr:NAD(P)/FAD-dependent oxidoreductase [Methanohalobium evestigatum]ADI73195.1 FAD dependent oxidoreductase [Methanohalobium evestigatum Z-7303]
MKTIVVGSGLGGLLSAAYLAKSGHDVEVFEALPFTGGRFTNIDYKGFKLSTGALHMVPHGDSGPLSQMLKKLNADVNIVTSNPSSVIRMPANDNDTDYKNGFRDMAFHDFKVPFSLINRIKIAFLAFTTKYFPPKKGTFDDWIKHHINEKWATRIANSFCGWSISLKSSDVSAKEVFEIISNLYRYSGPGVPTGGCKGITNALVEIIQENGGKIYTGKEVTEIITSNNHAKGVVADGDKYYSDLIISDIGHIETNRLCKNVTETEEYVQYKNQLQNIKSSAGIKISLACDEPLIGHGGVVLTPYSKRIDGMNEVTNVDKTLAPEGKHLVMTHQCLRWDRLDDIEEEIELGLQDIRDIFLNKDYEVLMVQSYHDGWPVNRSASSQDLSNKTPISNLYVVGDGAKGEGGIEIEGITLGVLNTMDMVLS